MAGPRGPPGDDDWRRRVLAALAGRTRMPANIPVLLLPALLALLAATAAVPVDHGDALRGLQRRGGRGAAADSDRSSDEEDAASSRQPTLDEDLAAALRDCMKHYVADWGARAADRCQQVRRTGLNPCLAQLLATFLY